MLLQNSCWCLDCGDNPKAGCEGRHSILDQMEDVKAIMGLLTDVSGTFSQATEKRQQIKDFLKAATASNDESLEKLRSLAEKEQLSAEKMGAAKNKLEDKLKQAKEEVEKANKMWNDLTDGNGKVESLNLFLTSYIAQISTHVLSTLDSSHKQNLEPGISGRGKEISGAKKRKVETERGDDGGNSTGNSSRHNFIQQIGGGLSVERMSSSQPLICRNIFQSHHGNDRVIVVEFSDDGSLLVSGDEDGRVLLWPTSKAIDEEWTPNPTAMETMDNRYFAIWCLAMSPDNERVFSGNEDTQVLIYNINT